MKIEAYYWPQIGFIVAWGVNYEKRPYIAIDFPFFTIQIFFRPMNKSE